MIFRVLILYAFLPVALSAGTLRLADGNEFEGTFSFSTVGGLHLKSTEGTTHPVEPGDLRSLTIDATDAIWPEELRVARTNRFGLLGEYFPGREFKGTPRVRVDTDLDFRWGGGSPLEDWRSDDFCVRWTGHFQVGTTGDHRFVIWSDDGVRLFINGRKLIDNWSDHAVAEDKATIRLDAAGLHEIRVDYFENSGDAELRVEWEGPDGKRRPLGELILITDGSGVTEGKSRQRTAIGLSTGIVLRDGTFLNTRPRRANDTAFELDKPFGDRTISTFNIARVVFREIPAQLAASARPGRQGALLVGGDFVDSEFQSIESGILNLSSLLFGLQKLDTKYETHALFLRAPLPERSRWRVRDRHGSVILAETLSFTETGLALSNAILHELHLPIDQLVEIETGSATDLFPPSLKFGPDSVHGTAAAGQRNNDAERRRIDSLKRMASQEKSRRKRELDKVESRIRSEMSTLADARRKVEEAEKKHTEATADLMEKRTAFNEKEKAYEALKKQREALESDLAKLNHDHSRIRAEIDKLESNRKREEARARSLEKSLNQRGSPPDENRIAAVKRQLIEVRARQEAYRNKQADLKQQYEATKKRRSGKERALSLNKRDSSGRKSALDRARRAKDGAERQLRYLSGTLEKYREQLASAENVVAERKRSQLR